MMRAIISVGEMTVWSIHCKVFWKMQGNDLTDHSQQMASWTEWKKHKFQYNPVCRSKFKAGLPEQEAGHSISECIVDRLCGVVVRAPGYTSRGPVSIPSATRFSEKQWAWNGVHLASWVQFATASSSCPKAQDACEELNCIDSEGSVCSSACSQSLLLGWIPCEQFQMSRQTVGALPCLLTCPVAVSSFLARMAVCRWSIVVRTENSMFRLLLWSSWETSHTCQHYRSGHCKCWCDRHVSLEPGWVEHCAV
jgi:hypothetical protein